MQRIKDRLYFIFYAPWLAKVLAIVGGVVYSIQSLFYARILPTILDEGAYLIKGYLFATGRYIPYEDYGPWMNHMPLSFLIPGYVQAWFGPGIRTGRYFSIVLGVLMLIGLWLVVHRLAGKWWALIAVWAIALNIAMIKAYALAVSQVLVSCILVWILVYGVGKDRSRRQLLFASALTGVLVMTRINLSPVLVFFLAYVFWQKGWRLGLVITIPAVAVIALGVVVYWPGIFTYMSGILNVFQFNSPTPNVSPPNVSPPNVSPAKIVQVSQRLDYSTMDRLNSILLAMRFNFIPLFSFITTLLLWQKKEKWHDLDKFRVAVSLGGLFVILLIIHAFASVGNNYCVFCLGGYMTFFNSLGLILFAISFRNMRRKLPKLTQIIIVILILAIFIAISYVSYDIRGRDLIAAKDMHDFLRMKVPRVRSLGILAGEVKLWILFQNKYGMEFSVVYRLFQRAAFSVIVGVIAWSVTMFAALLGMKFALMKNLWKERSFGIYALMSLLIVGMLLSPTPLLGGVSPPFDCEQDIFSSHEAAGSILSAEINSGAQIYWSGGNSAIPLLYLSDRNIFPAQLNGEYSYRIGGNAERRHRSGKWNAELSEIWLAEADYLLINTAKYDGSYIASGLWEEVAVTGPVVGCNDRTVIHVLKKIE